MLQLYRTQADRGIVDLYENDEYALNETIDEIGEILPKVISVKQTIPAKESWNFRNELLHLIDTQALTEEKTR